MLKHSKGFSGLGYRMMSNSGNPEPCRRSPMPAFRKGPFSDLHFSQHTRHQLAVLSARTVSRTTNSLMTYNLSLHSTRRNSAPALQRLRRCTTHQFAPCSCGMACSKSEVMIRVCLPSCVRLLLSPYRRHHSTSLVSAEVPQCDH